MSESEEIVKDTDDEIFCRLCYEKRKILTCHILHDHGITIKEYLEKFPDAPIKALNTIKKCTGRKWKMSAESIEKLKQGIKNSNLMQIRRDNAILNAKKLYEAEREQKKNLKDFVHCPLCQKEGKDEIDSRFQFITFHHIKGHNYIIEKFKEEFPGKPFKCETIKKEHSRKLSGENHFNYGKKLNDETRKKISESNKAIWNDDSNQMLKRCIKCNSHMVLHNKKDICNKCLSHEYGFEDTYEYVYCRICFRISSNLTLHITYDHKMKIEDYISQFKCKIRSEKTRELLSRKKMYTSMSEQHKQQITLSANNKALEKIKKEEDFNIKDYEFLLNKQIPNYIIDSYDYVYCRYCLRFMKRVAPAHMWTHGLTVWMYDQLFPNSKTIARCVINDVITKGFKTKIEQNCDMSREFGYFGYRKDLGHYVRSMIEANFCRILILNKISYEYEKTTFNLKHNLFSSYTPDILLKQDFFIWKKDTFIELKKYLDEESEKKIEVFREQYPNIILIVLHEKSKETTNLYRLYKNKIILWEDTEQNITTNPELY